VRMLYLEVTGHPREPESFCNCGPVFRHTTAWSPLNGGRRTLF
jgi:hypothetical protein